MVPYADMLAAVRAVAPGGALERCAAPAGEVAKNFRVGVAGSVGGFAARRPVGSLAAARQNWRAEPVEAVNPRLPDQKVISNQCVAQGFLAGPPPLHVRASGAA